MKSYKDKLKDPRWQRKRLEMLKRDDFQCQRCFDRDSPLEVHHKWYTAGLDPWEYDDECYISFCEFCHKVFHKNFIFEERGHHIPFSVQGINATDVFIFETYRDWILHENGKRGMEQMMKMLMAFIIKEEDI